MIDWLKINSFLNFQVIKIQKCIKIVVYLDCWRVVDDRQKWKFSSDLSDIFL